MNKKAQSIIEYVLIVVLVVLAIVFMGPYVLRSINGHFKLWDEGIKDSFGEHLHQAPVNDIPYINAECQCSSHSVSCGGGQTSVCGPGQMEWEYSCNLLGCKDSSGNLDGQTFCVNDASCCSYHTGSCGTMPIPESGLPAGTDTGEGLGQDCSPAVGNSCYYGQRIYAPICADKPIECCKDTTCDPHCMGSLNGQATMCPGFSTALRQPTYITYTGMQIIPYNSRSTSWVVPYYLHNQQITFALFGGGGGGAGGGSGSHSYDGSGGGGAGLITFNHTVTAGQTFYFHIGKGGAAGKGYGSNYGDAGGNGETTWISNSPSGNGSLTVSASGGAGGLSGHAGDQKSGGGAGGHTFTCNTPGDICYEFKGGNGGSAQNVKPAGCGGGGAGGTQGDAGGNAGSPCFSGGCTSATSGDACAIGYPGTCTGGGGYGGDGYQGGGDGGSGNPGHTPGGGGGGGSNGDDGGAGGNGEIRILMQCGDPAVGCQALCPLGHSLILNYNDSDCVSYNTVYPY